MNQKFVKLLEELDKVNEGFAGAMASHNEKTKALRDKIEKVCDCEGNSRSLKIKKGDEDNNGHDADCAAVKKGLVKESQELEEGRPKKEVDPDAPVKEKGKRGRPKKVKTDDEDGDDSGEEGKRTVTLTAKINVDGDKSTETKVLKNIDIESVEDEIAKWEKALHKKFNFDADISISKKIGDYEVTDADPENQTPSNGELDY